MISRRRILAGLPTSLFAARLMGQKAVLFSGQGNQLIIDTDLSTDVDDASDLAAAFGLQPNWNVIGIIISSLNANSPTAADAIARFCGWNFPGNIGVNHAATPSGGATSSWTAGISSRFVPNMTYAMYPEAVQTYRRLLSKAANNSITICAIGFATPLMNLLLSGGDDFSPLSGLALVTAKVKQLCIAGGILPTSGSSPEFDLMTDPVAFSYLAANWPTPVIWGGVEMATYNVGPPLSGPGSNPLISPVQYAYDLYGASNRPAYSAGCLMYGALGLSTNYAFGGTNGTMTINSGTGNNVWTSTPGVHSYLTKVASDATLQGLYNGYIQSA